MVRRNKKAFALRRKQQEASRQKTSWSLEDWTELVAWLDHTVTHKTIDFDETVIDHLKRTCDSDYTIKQVKSKLKAYWEKHGKDGYINQNDWKDVFDRGSEIYVLTSEETESIELARRRIEEYATLTLLETPRRTRGGPRPGDCRLSPLFSLETVVTPKRQHNSPKVEDKIAESPIAIRGTKRSASQRKRKMPPSKRKKKASLFEPSTPIILNESMSQENISPGGNVQMKVEMRVTKGQDMVGLAAHSAREKREDVETSQVLLAKAKEAQQSEEDNEKTVAMSSLFDGESDSDISIQTDCLDQANSDFKERSSQAKSFNEAYQARIDEAVETIKSLQQQVVHQHSKLCAYKKKKMDLEEEVRIMREAQTERDRKNGNEFEAIIERKNRYIREKVRELNDRRTLACFTASFANFRAAFMKTSFATMLNDIYIESRNILYQRRSQKPLLTLTTSSADMEDFHLLLKRSLRTKSLLDADINLVLHKLNCHTIVRLITMSALCEWVFKDNWPQFAEPSSELFEQYRQSVGKLDGARALRNLDLAAHSSIITSDDFRKHRIPKLAKDLAKRLSQALAPIFRKDSSAGIESNINGFPTWNQKKEEYETRLTRLRTIFEIALTAKADSLLMPEEYEMDLCPPGTKFNDSTMVAESFEVTEHGRIESDDRVVDVCLEAAVFSYPKKTLGDEPSFIPEALVRLRNFSQVGETHREGGKLLVKARVLLRGESEEKGQCILWLEWTVFGGSLNDDTKANRVKEIMSEHVNQKK